MLLLYKRPHLIHTTWLKQTKHTETENTHTHTHTHGHMKSVWMRGGGLEVGFCAVTVDANEQKTENRRGTCQIFDITIHIERKPLKHM